MTVRAQTLQLSFSCTLKSQTTQSCSLTLFGLRVDTNIYRDMKRLAELSYLSSSLSCHPSSNRYPKQP